MAGLVSGVVLWSVSHWFKRLAPDARARMGNAGKGVVALGSVVAIVLMVIGYRAADATPIWELGNWARHLNNGLMIVAVGLLGLGKSKSRLRGLLRHPMLAGVVVWAVAHLLVNGDLPSVVLFGGLGLWAIISMLIINRAEPDYEPFDGGTVQGDIRLAVITLVLFAVIVGIHTWLGVPPVGSA